MKVITSYPVIVDNVQKSPEEYYLNADASLITSSVVRIKAFQDWLDANKTPAGGLRMNQNVAAGYGTFNPITEAAWKIYSDEFVANRPDLFPQTVDPNLSATDPKGQRKLGKLWDKTKKAWVDAQEKDYINKGVNFLNTLFGGGQSQQTQTTEAGVPTGAPQKEGMSNTTKILLVVGGVAVLGTIVYLATRGTSKGK
jgi:hypothetical protein